MFSTPKCLSQPGDGHSCGRVAQLQNCGVSGVVADRFRRWVGQLPACSSAGRGLARGWVEVAKLRNCSPHSSAYHARVFVTHHCFFNHAVLIASQCLSHPSVHHTPMLIAHQCLSQLSAHHTPMFITSHCFFPHPSVWQTPAHPSVCPSRAFSTAGWGGGWRSCRTAGFRR